MAYYATIGELIESVNDAEISYRNLHTNLFIKSNDAVIKVPYKSITREYSNFFSEAAVIAELSSDEYFTYRFKPKKLSYDLYGTTELWSVLLELNGLNSIIEFDLERVKVYEPSTFMKLLNEVLILEKVIE